jgi:hypothetical protein
MSLAALAAPSVIGAVPDWMTGPGGWSPVYTEHFGVNNSPVSTLGDTYAAGNQIPANATGTTWTQSADGVTWTANASPVNNPAPTNPQTICTQSITITGSIKTGQGSVTLTNACPVSGTKDLLSYIGNSIGSFVSNVASSIVSGIQAGASWVAGAVSSAVSWVEGLFSKSGTDPLGSHSAELGLGYNHNATPIGHDLFSSHGSFH